MAKPQTIPDLFWNSVRDRPRPDAFLVPRGGRWEPVSTEQLQERVRRLAGGLRRLGARRGTKIAVLSYNRLEWALIDYAALSLGAITVPLYSTSAPSQVEYILKDSGSSILFVENEALRSRLPALRGVKVVGIEGRSSGTGIGFKELLEGEEPVELPVPLTPEDIATLLYTSGTTGTPKGVVLSHGNLVSNVLSVTQVLEIKPGDTVLSFLPLSHVFERMVDYVTFYQGGRIAYPESLEKVTDALKGVRPSVVPAVPRFFEKMQAGVQHLRENMSPLRRRILDWALSIGLETVQRKAEGRKISSWLRIRRVLADRLVLSKIRDAAGGNVRLFISGGAALAKELGEFLEAVGFSVIEGYGLTETSPVLTVNPPGKPKLGTVGLPIPGVEIRIAEDGEILARGPNIMKGYYNRPEETAKAIADGWFHTGDLGELDEDGYLRITGRKKDLFKTSGGKYVAPQGIENRLKLDPHVASAVVIGAGRPFPGCLIVPDFAVLRKRFGNAAPAELCRRPEVRAVYQALLDRINADLSRPEQVKKFELLPQELTIEGGELTPTMKVRRRVVEEKYREIIERMYRN